MKKMITVLICALLNTSAFAEDIKDVIDKKYVEKIEIENIRHTKELNKLYKHMLEDYKSQLKQCMRYNRLDDAFVVKKKLAIVNGLIDPTKAVIINEDDTLMDIIIGKWEAQPLKDYNYTLEFFKDGTVLKHSHNGKLVDDGKWKIEKEKKMCIATFRRIHKIEIIMESPVFTFISYVGKTKSDESVITPTK